MRSLVGSVGRAGQNQQKDVAAVQRLLNQNIRFLIPRRYFDTDGKCDDNLIDSVRIFQERAVKMKHPDGRVDPNGRTWQALNSLATVGVFKPPVPEPQFPAPPPAGTPQPSGSSTPPAPSPGHTAPAFTPQGKHIGGTPYTNDPREIGVKTTKADPVELVKTIGPLWPALTENGCRTLASQYMQETAGKNCYCWNLGNVKISPKDTKSNYMCLVNTWERMTPGDAQRAIDASNGLGALATPEECKKHGWHADPPKVIIVFQPPHYQTHFRAFATLTEGINYWIHFHQSRAAKYPRFVTALNDGDCKGVVDVLLSPAAYFTGSASEYANGMKAHKAALDAKMGPVKAAQPVPGTPGQ